MRRLNLQLGVASSYGGKARGRDLQLGVASLYEGKRRRLPPKPQNPSRVKEIINMEKYKRVKPNLMSPPDNEVRVNRNTHNNNYVRYVITQFKECAAKKVHIVAMGEAIYKVITIAELVKDRVPGLH